MDPRLGLLDISARLGQDHRVLEAYTRLFAGPTLDVEIDPEIRRYTPPSEPKGAVLLPLTQGMDSVISYSYCVLAHAFRTRGYRPILPLCHWDLDMCIQKEHGRDDGSACARCHYYGLDLLDSFGLDHLEMATLLSDGYEPPAIDESPPKSLSYRDVEVSDYAKATVRRVLKKRLIDYDSREEREMYRRLLRSAMTLVDVAHEIFDREDVLATIAHHPMYVYGGLFLAVAETRDVPAVSVAPGYNDQTLIFGNQRNRTAIPQFTEFEFLKRVVEEPLTEDQRGEVDRIMGGRVEGTGVRVHPAADADESVSVTDDRTTVALFTNLMWDASLEADNVVFTSAYAWVSSTIEYLAEADDVTLVVKPHPAEAMRSTRQGMAQWLRANYDPLPENVVLLEPETDVSPYKLLEDIDVGVVYNSTLGLEMAYWGEPVIVVSDTHYRGLGFTHDPGSVREYLDLLDRGAELEVDTAMHRRAQRYAHFLFTQKQIDFPFYHQSDLDIELLPVSHDEVAPGNEAFDRIVERVLADEPVVAR